MRFAIAFVLVLFTGIGTAVIANDEAHADPISYEQALTNYQRRQSLNLGACWQQFVPVSVGVLTNRCSLY